MSGGWREPLEAARLVAGKDLRIERRSQVGLRQILPFAMTLVVVFAFALDTLVVRDPTTADARTSGVPVSLVAPGLLWTAVLLSALLAIQRSIGLESDDARDALRLSGLDPAGIFLGKVVAIWLQLAALVALLSVGIVVFYDATLRDPVVLVLSSVLAVTALAATGTLAAAIAGHTGLRDTLMPIVFLPSVLPVLLCSVRAWQGALDGRSAEAWPWVRMLLAIAVIAVGLGIVVYGSLIDE
jgi:heme exporter protein B